MTIKGILALFHLLLLVSAAIHAKPPANNEESRATAAFARLKAWQAIGSQSDQTENTPD